MRRISSSWLPLLAALMGVLAAGAADPPADPPSWEAAVDVPIRTEGTALEVETGPLDFRSVRMRFDGPKDGRRTVRIIVALANVDRVDYRAGIEVTLLDGDGHALGTAAGATGVEAREPETVTIKMTIPQADFEKATLCRLKLTVRRD